MPRITSENSSPISILVKDRVRSELFTLVHRTPWAYTLAQRLNRLRRPGWLGISHRTTPLSEYWGYDRGLPVDGYYIERFLAEHRYDIQGRVLEVKDNAYTEQIQFPQFWGRHIGGEYALTPDAKSLFLFTLIPHGVLSSYLSFQKMQTLVSRRKSARALAANE